MIWLFVYPEVWLYVDPFVYFKCNEENDTSSGNHEKTIDRKPSGNDITCNVITALQIGPFEGGISYRVLFYCLRQTG